MIPSLRYPYLLLVTTSLMGQVSPSKDATAIPFEELLQTPYIPASHVANQLSNAASAVSIVTAEEIRDYGYRTLGEILGSMRGIQISYDGEYSIFGGRGFSVPGTYAGRIILLIDGYRADDSYFGQSYLGHDALLDVELIDRVEYIPGGGSAGYGDGALLGAINIITKNGSSIGGTQLSVGGGSHNTRQQRVTFGNTFKNGLDIVFSASTLKTDGMDYTDATESIHQNSDQSEKNKRLFLKASYENFSLLAAWVKRTKDLPSYPFSHTLGDPIFTSDENAFIRLKYDTDLSESLKLSTSLWRGQYLYGEMDATTNIAYGYIDPAETTGRWYGGDVKFIGSWFDNHSLSFGAGYRHDYEWSWFLNYIDQSGADQNYYYNDRLPSRKTYSLYLYDDFRVTPTLNLNYGARYEKSDNPIDFVSPRAALIWKPLEKTDVKLSYGESNRQSTPFETEENQAEKARTLELVMEHRFGWETKLLGSVYRYRLSDRIAYSADPADIVVRGAEIELEKHWEGGTRLRTGYAWQNAEETTGVRLINNAHHIAKLNISTLMMDERLRTSLEVQHLGNRPLYSTTPERQYTGGYTIANLNLIAQNIAPNLDCHLLVRNLFDKKYGDVIRPDASGDRLYQQDGRNFYLQLEYTFQ
jgi:outer membrane receptor for ferrienterochelin and colicin